MNGADRWLACGTPVQDLIAQVAEGDAPADAEHQRTCRFCQAALREIARRWQLVEQLKAETVIPPRRLLINVMRHVRAGLDRWQVEVPQERGIMVVPAHVLALAAYEAARAVPDVIAVRRARPLRERDVGEGAATAVEIAIELVVRYGAAVPRVTEAVRSAVIDTLQESLGLEVRAVHIDVTDIADGTRSSARAYSS
jgi:uncharacterized alkaline shock family protein YloU